jgi:hypothetical protein
MFIVATMLTHALDSGFPGGVTDPTELWQWMLQPHDYSREAIADVTVRTLMARIVFEHGGLEIDSKYPEGIPTTVCVHQDCCRTHILERVGRGHVPRRLLQEHERVPAQGAGVRIIIQVAAANELGAGC